MDNETRTYTVDMTTRVFIEATSEREAERIATEQFFDQHPFGEYYNMQSRMGVWHVFYVGDETDKYVWRPFPLLNQETTTN